MMKRFLLLICFSLHYFSYVIAEIHITLQKGDTYTIEGSKLPTIYNHETYYSPIVNGNAIAAEYLSGNTGYISYTIKIYAVSAGIASVTLPQVNNGLYIFHVVDVIKIDIPCLVTMEQGNTYTYTPIITDTEATTSLTWTSSNEAVASVDANGTVKAEGTGIATITCTAANGIKAQSLVSVSPLLTQSVTLDKQNQEIAMGEGLQLSASISPSNATSSNVRWLSGNENVAQVDNDGNVTAVGPGYCSIYALANDGSGKYDRCLIHVPGSETIRGDLNGDEAVDVGDIVAIIDIMTK